MEENNIKNKNKDVVGIVRILIVLLIIGLSYFLGNYIGSSGDEPALNTRNPEIKSKNTSNIIAVVDLDEGIGKNEKTYYSKEIIELPNMSFLRTGINDARNGLEDNKYGAYLVIPADFSQNVVSINQKPTKAKLKVEIDNPMC